MSGKRIAALITALITALCCINIGAFSAFAAEKEMTYTFSELSKVTEWGVNSTVTDDGTLNVTFTGQYQSQFYAIPSEISPLSIKKLVFNVTSDNAGALAYKLHTQADFDSGNKGGTPVSYGDPTVPATGEDVLYFSMMSLDGGETAASISSVTFYIDEDAATGSTASTGEAENTAPDDEFSVYPDINGADSSVPDLKNRFVADFGENVITGVSLTQHEMADMDLMALVTKHFNAVTLGNELKPDSMFGYSNARCPGTETAELNGETIEVPVLDYSRAERMLDYIYDWNHYNPDKKIMVRGHVLVWHSQTPEWFFHENYDKTQPYVTPEVMNKRLEWYIKTMFTHFMGDGSKYKGMFYGWDVVNEAVSDSKGTYRSDTEGGADKLTDDTHGSKSSWWAVYRSNEFIINAFKFANKYAPADVELYYNDYNDSAPSKVKPIVELLKAVKEADGTRIDGMGMQAHYMIDSPSVEQFIDAARQYAEVVDSVQLTEFDVRASWQYDGTDAGLREEYVRQAYRYREIYDAMKQLRDEGVRVGGFTIWGAVDKYSWLQGNSAVGGGADGTKRQCPLFFDDHYHAKPCFWAIVDPSNLAPVTKKVNVFETEAGKFASVKETKFKSGDISVSLAPIWNESAFQLRVTVSDRTEDSGDSVTLYLDKSNSKSSGSIEKTVVKRSEAEVSGDGYRAVFEVPLSGSESVLGFDVVVNDGDTAAAFNDTTMSQDETSQYFAEALLKRSAKIAKGTVIIDGAEDKAWEGAETVELGISAGAKAKASAKLLWDEENLYALITVTDSDLNASNPAVHEQDSVEIFIDEINAKAYTYNAATKQYRVNYRQELSFNGEKCTADNIIAAVKQTDGGYTVEAAIKWTERVPEEGASVGLELQVNDADSSGARIGTLNWYDTTNSCWENPSCFGNAVLTAGNELSLTAPSASPVDGGEGGVPTALIIGIAAAAAVIIVIVVIVVVKKKSKK